MAQNRSGPAAGNDEAGCFGGNGSLLTKKQSQTQASRGVTEAVTYQRVTGDIGPVLVLARRGCPPPAVVVERHPAKALVYYSSPPWGWGDQRGEFLDPGSPAVLRYARKLALQLREAALVEQGRRVRNRELARRERDAILASRRDGGR